MNFLDRVLNIIIIFSTIFALLYCIYITLQMQDMWQMLIEYQDIIKDQNDKIRDLQILVLKKNWNNNLDDEQRALDKTYE